MELTKFQLLLLPPHNVLGIRLFAWCRSTASMPTIFKEAQLWSFDNMKSFWKLISNNLRLNMLFMTWLHHFLIPKFYQFWTWIFKLFDHQIYFWRSKVEHFHVFGKIFFTKFVFVTYITNGLHIIYYSQVL